MRMKLQVPLLVVALLGDVSNAQVDVPPELAPGTTYNLIFATSALTRPSGPVGSLRTDFFGGLVGADWIVTYWTHQAKLPLTEDRPRRSNRHTTRISPSCRASRHLVKPGRSGFAPDRLSVKMSDLLIP